MSTTQARVSIPLRWGPLQIEGSEDFITSQLERLRHLVDQAPEASDQDGDHDEKLGDRSAGEHEGNPYENVLSLEDDTVNVIAQIPGATGSEKTINAALLGLLGARLSGRDTMPFAALRQICQSHGVLDEGNFAKYLKSKPARPHILVLGSGRAQSAKLTVPGLAAAKHLAASLNAGIGG